MKNQQEITEKQISPVPSLPEPRSPNPKPILRLLCWVEDGILIGLLLLLIAMAVGQIFLRNFFESSIFWGDVLTRILVLWIGLVGAMVASRQNKHISIDILTRYLSDRTKQIANGITALFTSVVCFVIAWHSFRFVQMEFESSIIAFAKVPAWACEAIIPFAFAVIGLRYFILSLMSFMDSLSQLRGSASMPSR